LGRIYSQAGSATGAAARRHAGAMTAREPRFETSCGRINTIGREVSTRTILEI
jgi:hypothetical protein